jgi:hypothetical protein
MKGRNGAAKPPARPPSRPPAKAPAAPGRSPGASRTAAPVETFSRFVSQLARLESERMKGGGGEVPR